MVGSPGRRIVSTTRHALAVRALLLAGITQAQTGAIRLRADFPRPAAFRPGELRAQPAMTHQGIQTGCLCGRARW